MAGHEAPEVAAMLSPRFDEQVVDAYRAGRLLSATGPGAWSLFLALSSVFVAGLALLGLGHIEMIAAGDGRVTGARTATSFVTEADRAALAIGTHARVELVHASDAAVLDARIAGIADRPVPPSEARALLAEDALPAEPLFRVDLELPEDARLFPGMRIVARYTLRSVRPIVLVVAPLARWLD